MPLADSTLCCPLRVGHFWWVPLPGHFLWSSDLRWRKGIQGVSEENTFRKCEARLPRNPFTPISVSEDVTVEGRRESFLPTLEGGGGRVLTTVLCPLLSSPDIRAFQLEFPAAFPVVTHTLYGWAESMR